MFKPEFHGSPHDGTDVPGQVPATGSGGEVLLRVQPVCVDHEVAVGQVAVDEERDSTGRSAASYENYMYETCNCVCVCV